jgi:hypothetical protein
MSVQNNEMSFNFIGDGMFKTGEIDISSGPVVVSLKVRGGTGLDVGSDYLKLFKKIDNGPEVEIGFANGPVVVTAWTANIASGNKLELIVRAKVSSATEYYYFDDMEVSGMTAGTPSGLLDKLSVNIYPNPAMGVVNIDFNGNNSAKSIRIINCMGQEIYKSTSNEGKIIVDLNTLNVKGIILIQILSDDNLYKYKVIAK